MAKNLLLCILFLIAVGEGGYIILNLSNVPYETSDILKSELKAIQRERDSLEVRLEQVRDTLERAYIVANNARIDTRKAEYESQRWRKQYEKVLFVDFANDSVRSAEIAKLYNSYKNP